MSRREKIAREVGSIGSVLVGVLLFILADRVQNDVLRSLLKVGYIWVPWVSFIVYFLFEQNKRDYLSRNKKLFSFCL
ncbi:hypothetical protein [Laceyella tengchongensis]|uniref:hypothetical protein n=1 Tax=Laceyella tengchongensis TaxID=574699 RepID=UPI0012B6F541|nr:hypothetical protein [Laceyella tengchongensis]HWO76926.1 hypothetical protein [Bacillus sp. (in: firmicutes)]